MKGDSCEVARPTLNLEQLQTLPVPVPPRAEQQEIIRRVESLFALADQIEARFKKTQAHLDKLTASLLARAFRGQLVPQDRTTIGRKVVGTNSKNYLSLFKSSQELMPHSLNLGSSKHHRHGRCSL